ncbi:hypothetical protein HO173_004009 [Letharia columbiana]|uniref:Uncharacterized protein n=1 Tax=Letharia columbiana TaxID=112416 RepID=A0A8H6FZT1_9LECA|nr:uncharacterized protein HO173_004009 [Letharia columbiana]KAF6237808.1 hypothetical protein HO173_004009 [Letharia columbiana]
MTLIVNQPLLYNMADNQADNPEPREGTSNSEVVSVRSRASSVISTGTKFSISTLPQGHFQIDDVLEGNAARTTSTRPGSMYSIRSIAPSLPPYEDQAPRPAPIQTSAPSGNDSEQPPTPSTADPENALSIHYGRVVRTIDENHARQLARIYEAHDQQLKTHVQELAATREAVDQAYRKEWKANNREIERIREEAAASVAEMQKTLDRDLERGREGCAAKVAALEERIQSLSITHTKSLARIQQDATDQVIMLHEEYQATIDKARNAIEDLWEGRWNDRTRLAAEEAQRRDLERDAEWLRLIENTHPELLDEMRTAMEASRAKK